MICCSFVWALELYKTCINNWSNSRWDHHMYEWSLAEKIDFSKESFYFHACFFNKTVNEGVSEEKKKQLRHMSVSYHIYAYNT